jgi:hypothetical protein
VSCMFFQTQEYTMSRVNPEGNSRCQGRFIHGNECTPPVGVSRVGGCTCVEQRYVGTLCMFCAPNNIKTKDSKNKTTPCFGSEAHRCGNLVQPR